jgi:hypothetical protein
VQGSTTESIDDDGQIDEFGEVLEILQEETSTANGG